ncbi:MAG: ribonuclease Y [Chloroflexi bacterium]|nr:ribonuclease Y [Chloroflexota bacterium]
MGLILGAALAGLGTGAALGYLLRALLASRGLKGAEQKAAGILREAEEQKKAMALEAKEEALRIRVGAENELKERRREVQRLESRLANRDQALDKRQEGLDRKEHALAEREQEIARTQEQVEKLAADQQRQLEAVANLSMAEARTQIMARAEADMKHELGRRYQEIEQEFKQDADQKARKIVTLAIQRLASDVVSETTTSVVPLPSDDMKGRLIGREGRNIRALEAATGVDLIIDDTPEAVTLSCFDPVRREVARLAVTKLITDGRIHPARIEEMVVKAQKEVEEIIRQEGEKAVFEAGVQGLNPELVRLLGRLKFRYSYGENVLKHCVEVSLLAGMMAAEIGANIQVAKAGGLLHDIGKALTHEVEGPHAEIGADVARRYGLPNEVLQAIMEHHDEEMGSVEAFLVVAADAISAARPGARKDTLEHYVKRLEALEQAASSFPGVEKCFAIHAGREVRIIVKPEDVDDVAAATLARDIVKKIQENLVYPGQIKVTVIRETRAVEYAK